MKKQPKAIVLGGTNPHIALIDNLKRRGYYTILVDYYENPPAKEYADEHIRESTLDQGKVLEIAQRLNAELVISTCIDQANVTACYVAENLGLPGPYSYDTALSVTNKGLMKKKMLDSGIPTSKFVIVNSIMGFKNAGMLFPVVVKPSDSTGSKGVKKACNINELEATLSEALVISRTNEAIIEEFKEGIEIQVDFFVQNKVANLIMMRQKLKIIDTGKSVLQSSGSIIPVAISEQAQKSVNIIANKIISAFGLINTSLFIQAIVKDDEVSVIEFASRIGGGLSYSMIKHITCFDILDATVDSFLGLNTDIKYRQSNAYYATNIIYARPGIFDSITGYKELLSKKIIEEFFFFKTKGMEIGLDLASRNRVGAFLVKAGDKPELYKKLKLSIDKLEVFDDQGCSIMRKDLLNEINF